MSNIFKLEIDVKGAIAPKLEPEGAVTVQKEIPKEDLKKEPKIVERKPFQKIKEKFRPRTKEEIFTQTKQAGAVALAGAGAIAISNVGTITGSQATQNQVNNITKVLGVGVLAVTNLPLAIAVTALEVGNNALKFAKETRQWNLAETRNSERLGIVATKRGRV